MFENKSSARLLVPVIFGLFLVFVFQSTKTLNSVPQTEQLAQVSSSLDNGLVAKWSFDEGSGTTANDSVGGNAVSFTGALSWGAGKIGGSSVNLDGISNYGLTTNAISVSTEYSYAFWIKAPQGATLDSYAILSWAATTCRFGGRAANTINCYVDDTSGGSAYYGTTLNDGAWHHIVFTSTDGGSGANNQVLYVDGIQRGTATETNGGYSSKLWIGSYINGGGKFKGALDDLLVYNRVLNSTEVSDLYNGAIVTGGVVNPVPTQNPITPTNPVPTSTPPPATSSNQAPIVSAGTNKTITLPNTLTVSGSVTDDGLPSGASVTTTWSVVSGGSATFSNVNNIATDVTFPTAGTYILRLTASDSLLIATSDITVTVNTAPILSTEPKTWNVAKGGGDFPSATYPIQACANVAKAGDTCLVQAGEYDDYVTTKAGGVAGSYLTFQASGRVVMNGFWVKHPYVKITGFDITQGNIQKVIAQAPYETRSVHIDAGANNCIFSNNTIKNGPFVNLKSAYFNSSDKTISFTDNLNDKYVNGGFLKAGIKPGDPLTIQAFEAKPISNQSQKRVYVSRAEGSVTDRVLRLSDSSPITQEGPVNAFITAFNTSDVPFNAIYMEGNNCQISDNVFENLNAFGIIFSGTQNVISRNKFSLMAGGDIFQVWGHDHLIQYNYITNSTPEIVPGAHQDFFQTYATGGPNAYNITFDHNFIENFDGALAQMNSVRPVGGVYSVVPGFHDIYFTNNVFYNITGKASVDILNTKFINNTFYNVGSETRAAIIFSSYVAGDNGGDADGGVVKNNAFVAIGNSRSGGWYSFDANTQLSQNDYNYVAGAPDIGYQSKTGFTEAHGVNGGDPSFFNASNPVGVDGVPFTADDGLAPLLGSSLCDSGEGGTHIGAYRCLVPNGAYLLPRFTSLPSTNGYAPLTVNFDASGSRASGGISSYSWDFGDGKPVQTGVTASHVFSTPGTYRTILTVTTSDGRRDTASQTIFVNQPGIKFYFNFDGNLQANTGASALWRGVSGYASGKINQGISPGSSYVEFPYNSDLDGMSQLSISVWAKKNTASGAGVLVSKSWLYSLDLTSQGAIGKIAGEHPVSVSTGTGDTNWHHYVLTYDGSIIKLYIDKKLVVSNPFVGSIPKDTTTSLLVAANLGRVGFSGVIDELKIYNKALNQTEVDELFGSSNDSTAPILSLGSPSNSLAVGTKTTNISLATNESAVCKYSKTANVPYGSMSSTFSQTGGLSHTTSVSGLEDGVEYSYYVKCADVSLNETVTDYIIKFQVASVASSDGLVMHLDFNNYSQGPVVDDASSKGNSGHCNSNLNQCPTLKIGPDGSTAAGFYGAYPDKDNSGDYLSINKATNLSNLSKGAIMFWVKFDNQNSTISTIIDSYQKTGENPPGTDNGVVGTWSINTDYQGSTRFIAFDKNNVKQTVINFPDSSAFTDVLKGKPTWNHYAIVWDGSFIKGYYNGNKISESSQSNFPYFTQGLYLAVGANGHSSAPESGTEVFPNHGFANATLDDIRIYNTPITPGELAGIYLATGGSSISAANSTPTPAPVTPTTPVPLTPDTTLPTITITSPQGGTTISGSVSLSATAQDPTVTGQTNSGVAGVQFKLDNINLGQELTTAPYSGTWNTLGVPNGNHTLTAIARDMAGNSKTSIAVTVTISNTPTPTPTPTPLPPNATPTPISIYPTPTSITPNIIITVPPVGTLTPTVPQKPVVAKTTNNNTKYTLTKSNTNSSLGTLIPDISIPEVPLFNDENYKTLTFWDFVKSIFINTLGFIKQLPKRVWKTV